MFYRNFDYWVIGFKIIARYGTLSLACSAIFRPHFALPFEGCILRLTAAVVLCSVVDAVGVVGHEPCAVTTLVVFGNFRRKHAARYVR